jgi:hypothetical protein
MFSEALGKTLDEAFNEVVDDMFDVFGDVFDDMFDVLGDVFDEVSDDLFAKCSLIFS